MIAKLLLSVFSLVLSVFAVEMGLQLLRHPMDFLEPDVVSDPVLGRRMVPGSGGHDAWGYRNLEVPEQVDVVAVGDSQTWGNNATWQESWPRWYSRLSGRPVYNMGIGGYGPAEYLSLIESKAFLLQPKLILVGLYYGNDIHDSYQAVRLRRHWESLRTDSMGELPPVEANSPVATDSPKRENPIKTFRNWLRRNSMLFRAIEQGPVGQRINAAGDQMEGFGRDGCILKSTEPFATVFQPENRYRALNLEENAVSEGVDLTLEFLKRISELTRENNVELFVILIPTKESVVLKHIDEPNDHCEVVLNQIIESEALIGRRIRRFLEENEIPYVDTLEGLQAGAMKESVYSISADSHPTGEGYRVIAEEAVAASGPSSSN